MTENQPLGLSANQKKLREQRALAMGRLANSSVAPRVDAAPDRSAYPKNAPLPQPLRSNRAPADKPYGGAGAPRPDPRVHLGERFDSPHRDHKGARPISPVDGRKQQPLEPAQALASVAGVARRVAAPTGGNEGTRLNKRMAELRMCSRREGDAWIEQGWVMVNGAVAEIGQMVQAGDRIEVNEQAKGQQEQQVTILMHKPMGFVSAQAEDGHQPAVALINPRTRWQHCTSQTRFNFSQLQGLAPAGRLDIDSVGLLVLTQDGRVARQLIGEDSEIEKEYLVRVTCLDQDGGDVSKDVQAAFPPEQLALLRLGLSLDGEPLKPAEVEWQNPEQLRFVLKQGKKRQIRRMCEQVGLKVVGLKRIRMGRVTLGSLPVGQWRYLGASEQF